MYKIELKLELKPFIQHCLKYSSHFFKLWRGTVCRIRYQKTLAVYKIMDAYRRYKLKSYLRRINDAFRGVERMHDFGKSVRWPQPPEVLRGYVETLKRVHRR